MNLRNHLIVPFRLYKLISEAHTVKPIAEIADNTVLVIDNDGHVHELHYHRRLIDQPYTPTDEDEETT